MKSYILRSVSATLALFGVFLTNASGCALESAPTVDDPGLETETACGPCALGYTAQPVNGGCNPYVCSCDGDWAIACGAQGGSCSSCDPGEACANGACTGSSCTNGNHSPGEPCVSSRGAGVWGFGGNNSCVCCTGCFDRHTGICVMASANDANHCGTDGGWCDHCNAGTCNFGQCSP